MLSGLLFINIYFASAKLLDFLISLKILQHLPTAQKVYHVHWTKVVISIAVGNYNLLPRVISSLSECMIEP